jgi:hypothetical protein
MRALSFGLAAAVAILLFGAFGSLGVAAGPSVTTRVVGMYAVLPDGRLVDLQTKLRAIRGWTL